ncbi:MarR family winged helix-turn-helix transcriptional regulator [Pseudoalteromonas agarivorans]|uniref:MarR family winged helix-turn-helix transcriptional regulator n=1 Tax=Pseudoalteromonas agarivorans TaxID=176102 RepID=UPI00211909AC|nr:MarR family winged helix-turn-helix transcriptional regulator [Pseudoalteromonas agarivorans]MCQ8820414.1 MarR family winged helix-turn-helix transcriptional regulator [Pseudoalteromonas agarivorans]
MNTLLSNTLFELMQNYRVTIREAINAGDLGINAMHVRCIHIIASTSNCTANDIVTKTQRDKAQIARLIKDLIALNLINKQASDHDKRCFILSLTKQGNTLFDKLLASEQQINDQMCKNLNPQQIKDFLDTAQQMIKNMA